MTVAEITVSTYFKPNQVAAGGKTTLELTYTGPAAGMSAAPTAFLKSGSSLGPVGLPDWLVLPGCTRTNYLYGCPLSEVSRTGGQVTYRAEIAVSVPAGLAAGESANVEWDVSGPQVKDTLTVLAAAPAAPAAQAAPAAGAPAAPAAAAPHTGGTPAAAAPPPASAHGPDTGGGGAADELTRGRTAQETNLRASDSSGPGIGTAAAAITGVTLLAGAMALVKRRRRAVR
ncbi:hypothetical protein GCM10020229_26870 [Kitasatospora albolonga]|uniref:hypothetical protein n=1 Tax=Kitasatospora albolonga TaxID=68173 RepID=UPI0031E60D0B